MTIGSGSCAILLTNKEISKTGNQLTTAVARANTSQHRLCHSGADEAAASGMQPLMETDSESLLREGIATGVATFEKFLRESGWSRDDIDKTICHQVGKTHRKMMLDALSLPSERDFATVEWLGNTGSVALPMSLAMAAESGHLIPHDRLGLLGIGSGINSLMLAVHWCEAKIAGDHPHRSLTQGPIPVL